MNYKLKRCLETIFILVICVIGCLYNVKHDKVIHKMNNRHKDEVPRIMNNLIHMDSVKMQHSLLNWTVMVTVSLGFHDMFDNWWFFYKNLNLTMDVIMVSEDSATYNIYKNTTGLNVKMGDHDINNTKPVNYNTEQYKKMVSKRPAYVLSELKQGRNIIYSDVDTVWMADPSPYFIGQCDMWISLDANMYCTGFMACRKHSKQRTLCRNGIQHYKGHIS